MKYDDDDVVAFVFHWLQPNTLQNPNPADFNLDGIADLADWSILNAELLAFGSAIAAALSVPEPSAVMLIVLGGLALAWRRP